MSDLLKNYSRLRLALFRSGGGKEAAEFLRVKEEDMIQAVHLSSGKFAIIMSPIVLLLLSALSAVSAVILSIAVLEEASVSLLVFAFSSMILSFYLMQSTSEALSILRELAESGYRPG